MCMAFVQNDMCIFVLFISMLVMTKIVTKVIAIGKCVPEERAQMGPICLVSTVSTSRA